jgi:hypothetical protein
MSHPSIERHIYAYKHLKAAVQQKAVDRLAYEGLENDDALTNPKSRYYNNRVGYSTDRFAYYPCSKCRQPYFGGRRQCEEVKEGDEKFNANELVCGGCSAGPNAQSCVQHGKDYIEFKCKFCCAIATYYW